MYSGRIKGNMKNVKIFSTLLHSIPCGEERGKPNFDKKRKKDRD